MKHRRIPWVLILPLLIFVPLGVTLMIALHHGVPGNKFATHINEPAPETHLPVMGDPSIFFNTSDWIGKPYVVNFFASWCAPCHAEHDQLMMLNSAHVTLIGIALQDKQADLGAFLSILGNPFLVVTDDTKALTSMDWGLTGVPETFVIDKEGIIRFHFVGPLTEDIVTTEILPLWRSLQ